MVRTRLDAVVTLREREEDRKAEALAKAEREARAAAERAAQARLHALKDERSRTDSARWAVVELAHHRALLEAHRAESQAAQARSSADGARVQYTAAHQQAEVVRRVAEHRREDARRELNRVEDKHLDEMATLLFSRKAG